MSVDRYLGELGHGEYQAWSVPDLVPSGPQRVELLFVFESPHTTELKENIPVSGSTGVSALEYLLDARSNESLGNYVSLKHKTGDYRVGIVNVSNVPLQKKAFTGGSNPPLSSREWQVISRVRTSKARLVDTTRLADANRAGLTLLSSLQARLDALNLDIDCTIVPAGDFARRFTKELSPLPAKVLTEIPHPSRNSWSNSKNLPELVALRDLFSTSTLQLTKNSVP